MPAKNQTTSRAYLAILVGPSLGTPKSKVIYGVDNFATRVWGQRNEDTSDDENEEEGSGEELPEDSEDDGTGEEIDSNSEGGSEEEEEGEESEEAEGEEEEDEEEESGDDDSDDDADEDDSNQENADHNYSPPSSPHQSYAEEQRFLQMADRLLSRTLASADAESHAISNEMCTPE